MLGFCIFFIAWFINLYNFMDGADGLAASTAVVSSLVVGIDDIFLRRQEHCL